MSKLIKTDSSYKAWITELKQRIRQSQIKAAVKVNVEMLHLYWSIGEDIIKRNAEAVWGKSVINQLFEGCITKIIDSVPKSVYVASFLIFAKLFLFLIK